MLRRNAKYQAALCTVQVSLGTNAPVRVQIPKFTRIEHYQNIVKSYHKMDVSEIQELLPKVRVVPLMLADQIGWTPQTAFACFATEIA